MDRKMNKNYVLCTICLFVFLFVTTVFVTQIDDIAYYLDTYFKPSATIEEERFTEEYSSGTVIVYHDKELNVTCYMVSAGLSCIPDIHLNRSDGKVKEIETKHTKEVM